MAMAPPHGTFPSAAEDGEDLSYVLDVARDALAHEFQVSERLDAKARGQMTLAGAWFAVVQAVAGVALANSAISNAWGAAVVGSATIAAASLGWAFYCHYAVWRLRSETGFNADALHAFGEWAADDETNLAGTLIGYYEQILSERQGRNRERVEKFDKAVPAWFFTLGLTLIELMVALFAAISA
jgi:hypothetical protein